MIQTTAQIEPGDSGGPLADSAGMVIGMDTAAGTGPQAVGYAIPIDVAMAVERQIAAGTTPRITIGVSGFLGVVVPSTAASSPRQQARQEQGTGTGGGGSLSPQGCVDMESESGVPATIAPARSGALVDGVLCDTGAAVAGIRPGDVITAAAGQPVTSPDALTVIMSNSAAGDAGGGRLGRRQRGPRRTSLDPARGRARGMASAVLGRTNRARRSWSAQKPGRHIQRLPGVLTKA